ncbi:MAG: DUF1464 family protein, partial [Candidatus Hodarchaeota archaeon]
ALKAYIEGTLKDIGRIRGILPNCEVILVSGRFASNEYIIEFLQEKLDLKVFKIGSWGTYASHAAQGGALIANGLFGGEYKALVDILEIKRASGSILDKIFYELPDL